MKVFLMESPSPNDLLDNRNEANSLKEICNMFEHQFKSFLILSKSDLKKIINYLKDVELNHKDYVCFHFSCHGNDDGIFWGSDFLEWDDFFKIVKPLFKNNDLNGKYSFIISACGANEQTLTDNINKLIVDEKKKINPPDFLIIYDENEVLWKDALLSWTILYHQLSNETNITRKHLQSIMKKMKSSEFGDLIYFRWEGKKLKYLKYAPKE